MKIMFTKYIAAAVLATALVQCVQANSIVGTIGFTGRVALDTGTASTASRVVQWVSPKVNGTSGDFTSLADGTAVNIFSPWNFVTGSTVTSFWTCGAFTFDLTSSSVTSQGGVAGISGYVNVSGFGIVRSAGYDDTYIIWNFSSQDPRIIGNPDSFTFSVSQTSQPRVPDAASTLALLGLALSGAGLLRKKLAV
jgi:hypothetical protein